MDVANLPRQITSTLGEMILDRRATVSLNKTLETEYVAVYRYANAYKRQWRADAVDWSTENFVVVTKTGRLLIFTNSEWGGVSYMGEPF